MATKTTPAKRVKPPDPAAALQKEVERLRAEAEALKADLGRAQAEAKALKADLGRAQAEAKAAKADLDRRKERYRREIEEFNAGAEAAQAGHPLEDDAPEMFAVGYKAAAHDGLLERLDEAKKALDAQAAKTARAEKDARTLRVERDRLAARVADEADLYERVQRAEAHAQAQAGEARLKADAVALLQTEVARLAAEVDRERREADQWRDEAFAAQRGLTDAAAVADAAQARVAAVEDELKRRTVVVERAANHTRHYRALVNHVRSRDGDCTALAELLGESAAVASALWEAYGGEG